MLYAVYMNDKYDKHIIDYINFNDEQMAWYDEHQLRQARHSGMVGRVYKRSSI